MKNQFDEKVGPVIAVSTVMFCTILLGYFLWIDWRDATSGKYKNYNSNCIGQLQIAGYCCKSIEQYNTGSCTN